MELEGEGETLWMWRVFKRCYYFWGGRGEFYLYTLLPDDNCALGCQRAVYHSRFIRCLCGVMAESFVGVEFLVVKV